MSTLTTLETKTAATAPRPSATGEFRAVFATFDVPDHDGDVTRPGAFRDGAEVIVGPWGHKDGGLPTGRGVIRTNNREAFVEGNFFLDTPHGLATYETVKSLGNLAEWSYQFRATQTSRGRHEGQPVLLLEGIRVFSVDPVLVGAGIDTRTDHIKTSPTGLLHREQARFDETLFRLEMARYAKTREDLIASRRGPRGRDVTLATSSRASSPTNVAIGPTAPASTTTARSQPTRSSPIPSSTRRPRRSSGRPHSAPTSAESHPRPHPLVPRAMTSRGPRPRVGGVEAPALHRGGRALRQALRARQRHLDQSRPGRRHGRPYRAPRDGPPGRR